MERCPNCKTEILFADAAFCEHCGVNLSSTAGKPEESDDLRMEVTEASNESKPRPSASADDDLGIRSGAALVAQWQDDEVDEPTSPTSETGKIPQVQEPAQTVNGLKKLSTTEVKTIEQKLYPTGKFITDDEKQRLIQNMSTLDSGKPKKQERVPAYRPAVAAENGEMPKPTISKRGRGVAYFYRNFVQFSGEIDFREQDEIVVNERTYTLRRKKLNPRVVTGAALAAAAVLAVAVVGLLVRGGASGQGRVVGLVLDEYNRPFAYGALVNFPDLDVSVKTNGQGFFVSDDIPAGSHKIEYRVNDQIVGTEYATVASGDMTTLTLRPSAGTEEVAQIETATEPVPAQTRQVEKPPVQPPSQQPSPAQTRSQPERPSDARLTLAANVEGARLSLDGSVTGAGNLTYTRLQPGQHKYTVAKEGYETVSGIVSLQAGENTRLEIDLQPVQRASRPSVPARPQESPLLTDAQDALQQQQYETAIGRFDQLIASEPNMIPAYVGRSEAHLGLSNNDAAYNDLVRAAEISAARGENRQAITYYHRAIEINDRKPVAFLGRGRLYLQQREEIAAVADFETVTTMDRRNADAYVGLGEARYNQGNYKQSIKHFKDALNADSRNVVALEYLMLAYMATNDFKNVKKTYERYSELATQEQLSQLSGDNRFVGVLRIVNAD